MTADLEDPNDPFALAATLIRDVAEVARRARRYRMLATSVAETAFDRALAIGSDVRSIARRGDDTAGLATLTTELRTLAARCEAAIGALQRGVDYVAAVAAFRARDVGAIATLAPGIFTGVVPYRAQGPLYVPLPLAGARRGPEVLPATACAARVRAIAAAGLQAEESVLELGGDETIRPILLADEHDSFESPLALVVDAEHVRIPLCGLEGGSVVLAYTDRLVAPLAVSCHTVVDDEWWRVRPDAYGRYVDELEAALRPDGITFRRVPAAGGEA